MRLTSFILTAVAVLACAGAAAAETTGQFDGQSHRWYGEFGFGYSWPGTVNSHSTRPAPDGKPYDWRWTPGADWSMHGSIGYRITPHFRTELEVGFADSRLESVHAPGGQSGGFSIARPLEPYGLCTNGSAPPLQCISTAKATNRWTWTFSAMANVIYDVLPDNKIDPFVGVGVGLSHVQWPSTFQFSAVPGPYTASNPPVQYLKGAGTLTRTSELAFQVLGGVSYRVAPRVRLDLTYRHLFTAGDFRWNPENITPHVNNKEGLQPGDFLGRFQDDSITASVRYAFL